MSGNKLCTIKWKNLYVWWWSSGQAPDFLTVKWRFWPDETPPSQAGLPPQLSVATQGQASLLLKITTTTTGVLRKSHLSFQTQNTTLISAFHGQRQARRNNTAEQARSCAISINAHCLRASQQQHWKSEYWQNSWHAPISPINIASLYVYMHTHTSPNTLEGPNLIVQNSSLSMSLRQGRTHQMTLMAPLSCPTAPLLPPLSRHAPQEWGPSTARSCSLCHRRSHHGQVALFPIRTVLGNQQRMFHFFTQLPQFFPKPLSLSKKFSRVVSVNTGI